MRSSMFIAISICISLNTGCAILSDSMVNDAVTPPNDQPAAQPTPEITFTNANRPERIAIIWKENAFQSTGRQPTRGFTGRVYFYDANDELLQVDGDLIVYGYDDSQTRLTQQADHVYKFPAEKFKDRYHPSELGHSYAIWIPWRSEDRIRKSISLVAFFKTSEGKVLEGSMNRLVLSGNPPPNESHVEKKIVPSANQPESAIAKGPNQHSQNRRMGNVDTYSIPHSLAQRMQNVPPSRIPPKQVLQHLNEMEVTTNNPEGSLYNRTQISRQQIPGSRPVIPPQQTQNRVSTNQSASATSLNFSDAWETPANASNTQPQRPLNQIDGPSNKWQPTRMSSFGKPGTYR